VTPDRIAELLVPFDVPLDELRLNQISTYIDLLVRWNARINLTAIRDPEDIVTRHFGESLFAARHLFPTPSQLHAIDIGSGAGFPGIPLKIWNPLLRLTLIESNHKKATFLREVVRSLTLTDVDVIFARAETHPPASADLVTLRAVERFESILPTAANLVAKAGRLALLLGHSQVGQIPHLAPQFSWNTPVQLPQSNSRILLVGTRT
jgi:16S rRNA (guanine527-N7)-methyltransferase